MKNHAVLLDAILLPVGPAPQAREAQEDPVCLVTPHHPTEQENTCA